MGCLVSTFVSDKKTGCGLLKFFPKQFKTITMYDQILKLVKENAGEAIMNNPAITGQQKDAAIGTAATVITDHLKKAVSGGNAAQLTSLLQGNNLQNNPLVSGISSTITKELMSKFGIDAGAAGGIVQKLIPVVMSQFVGKTNDPNDKSFDLKNILGAAGGKGAAGGILSGISKIFGSKK
jgi:hypothetical protein